MGVDLGQSRLWCGLAGAIAALAGLAVIGFEFLPWYGYGAEGVAASLIEDIDANAWRALDGADVAIALLAEAVALAGLAVVAGAVANVESRVVFAASLVASVAALALCILLGIKVLEPPFEDLPIELDVNVGAYLSVGAAMTGLAVSAVALVMVTSALRRAGVRRESPSR
jgi:hypothetical protein